MISKIFNRLCESKEEKQFRLLAKGIKIGRGFQAQFHPNSILKVGDNLDARNFVCFWVGKNAELKIGTNVFINNYCSINCLKNIEIGDDTLLGEGVKIYDHNHEYSFENDRLNVSRKAFTYGEVKIGKNCWLGSNVVILKGVRIGDNSIIGAGCVIHKDVPANSVIVAQQELTSK